jgi:hypothetical protein
MANNVFQSEDLVKAPDGGRATAESEQDGLMVQSPCEFAALPTGGATNWLRYQLVALPTGRATNLSRHQLAAPRFWHAVDLYG